MVKNESSELSLLVKLLPEIIILASNDFHDGHQHNETHENTNHNV